MTEQTTDDVITRHEAVVEKFKGRLSSAEALAERAQARVVRPDGNTRIGAASEMAARRVEIDALKDRVRMAEAELADARDDAPRRAKERAQAEKLEAEAQDLDGKVAAAREALVKAEAAHARKVAEAEAARHRASRTKAELDRDAEREAEADRAALRSRLGREPSADDLSAARSVGLLPHRAEAT